MGRRIMVTGCSGAGKSTLARQIGAALDIPVTHLDRLYWRPGWVAAPPEEFRAAVAEAAGTDSWVIDGNYSKTFDLRLPFADTVVLLDASRYTCLHRVVRRQVREWGQETQAAGCVSKIDLELVQWIWNWPARRPLMLRRIATEAPAARQVLLRSPREVSAFLQRLR
ncbi:MULTISPECIES: P-loop NTPase family protein [Amycolatopsis]|uniref:DNA topology modulation protein FlaR n=1 Tax=Amycolatopsis albidoflavus TaxID=102226 RepID=A0ABW5HT78_9PSEU